MSRLFKFFSKSSSNSFEENNSYNWFQDRYRSIVIQRNILFVFFFISVILVLLSILSISYISTSKTIRPFVVEIDKNTGSTRLITHSKRNSLLSNDALNRYFINRYVIARETFNPLTFEGLARDTVRLMSSGVVYRNFLGLISQDQFNPEKIYGENNTSFLKARSFSSLGNNRYMYRFSIHETRGNQRSINRVAIIEFEYQERDLNSSEREINPIGFTVIGYSVSDETGN